tara:strand:+ start:908 stop:1258 length:351 start_codon:yes stop_codon:yes gene_type:complete
VVDVHKGRPLKQSLFQTGNEESDRAFADVQQDIDSKFRSQQQSPFATGRIIAKVQLAAGVSKRVAHKLGRRYVAWSVVRKSADSGVWESDYSQPANPEKFIYLTATADVTVDIVVG